jgi:hypothetical protein
MRSRARFSGLAVILVASALGPQAAHADLRSTPAPVTEAGCDVSVAIEGPIARVTETHRLAPGGSVPALAAYSAPLAPGAVVDDFMVAVAGREERGLLVPAESLENRTPVSLGLGADLGVLRVDTARSVRWWTSGSSRSRRRG